MRVRSFGRARVVTIAFISLHFFMASRLVAGPVGFAQINLTSDIAQGVPNVDPNLKNPWGMSFGPSTPFWVSNEVTGTASLLAAGGAHVPLVVTIAGAAAGNGSPTGQVFVGGMGYQMKGGAGAASFVFATLEGTINAWNGSASSI